MTATLFPPMGGAPRSSGRRPGPSAIDRHMGTSVVTPFAAPTPAQEPARGPVLTNELVSYLLDELAQGQPRRRFAVISG